MEEKYKDLLVKIIHTHLPFCAIYLFGSRARKTNTPGADIDLALDAKEKINRRIIANILEEIDESVVPFCVDIVDFHAVSYEMREEILKERIIWSS